MINLIVLCGNQEMIWTVGACNNLQKQKNIFFGTNNCSKIRTYTVLNTLSGECNFEISGLRYCKTLS